ncbi:MAG TPA: RimK family alpha-L-glutamate ligase [Polyangiaceae bacterium LLY-WYZ-15_(1-7)]|nr:RimK family alpha-L-glutamate ligase [Polyangiaceae bacterium LLY-WYZ-15_(1-7)]HJL10739.1 RimK family alpha-L-glutamate ligase [Polyangiaceae bacterium LLY-WYZ-15_(1-7)]HJL33049.1 RimK family alpha-L-glutamate ligase [Polyangiaceae bacterium LLY-WYZ-15_(1-7)]HJL34214.1 RimK family alpha-L-glutamate ligase [Polyangiaceae bacterium LLY-WYZ-15_(1-7)]HJL46809.1 RimK family alpha-L-glutamate ligase [Polyangiaceae bacterium LLY-WYZ-15_(1-7)]
MRVAILTREPQGSAARLVQALEAWGHVPELVGTFAVTLDLAEGHLSLHHRGVELPPYDAVLARIGHSATFHGATVLRHLELMGVPTFPCADALLASRDKLRSLQLLAAAHVPVPETSFVRRRKDLGPAIERLGGAPLIVKVTEGTQGKGVLLAESARSAEAMASTLLDAGKQVLLQRFVSESRGRDVRAFVVGDEVVAAARRVAQGDEYRSNVHLGASAEKTEIEPAYAKVAVRAAKVLGLPIAGVDLLEGKEGPMVVEVNSSPGIVDFERVTETDVAGRIVEHVEDIALRPHALH